MMQIPKIELRPWLEMFWRRKWWIVVPTLLALIAGTVHLTQTTREYRATTLILVESQRVPRDYVPSTVTDDLQKRLQTISQQVHSRTNLESIIERFELYPSREDLSPTLMTKIKRRALVMTRLREASAWQQQPEAPSMQQLVRNVRNKIDINLRARNQAFEISFEWGDPQVAAQVANALASQFIDQNLRVREEMAMGTTRFLDQEVQRLQQELQQREIALEDFKRRNMGRLPSQLRSNMNMLSQLKEELNRTEDQSQTIRQQIQLTQSQAQMQTQSLFADYEMFESGSGATNSKISSLEETLKELRSRYTEQHPDIQMLKRRLAQLQAEEEEELEHEPVVVEEPVAAGPDMFSAHLEQMQQRLADNEDRMRELRDQIRVYEDRIEQTSEVELELKNLERDYSAVNDRFQLMLRRKLDAELGEQMERRQQGEQFRVVDPAISPDRPFKPDTRRSMFVALVLGLGLGCGLGYLREVLDSAFYTPQEVEQVLNCEVVVNLPYVKKK